ncbi:hypothetical protein HII31_05744 [Pseudocercospora fuligena]|uniref:Uncharacterized protein n=1 Tax=Pseudocercospora fuligena TaxID=685502 RepID=A0A8H6RKS1_9PEZI|nr:hypothetical protein HII31_05744 [Pseudocercospora fuligena]
MSPTMKNVFTAGLAILAAADAATTKSKGKQPAPGSNTQSFLINYNFETYPRSVTSQVPVSATVIGDYDLLNFNTVLVNQTQPPVAGVACHTAPTCTVVTLANNLLSSLLAPGQSTNGLTGPQRVTSKYQYSPISYFDPYAFYYGCVVADANGAASLPANCDITVTGQQNGKTIYSQKFSYKATGAVLQQMSLGFFDQGWQGLKVDTLNFAVSNNATTAALIDNLVASVFGPQNAAVLVDF